MANEKGTPPVTKTTTYPVDDFDRTPLKVAVGYTDVTSVVTHTVISRRGDKVSPPGQA